MAPPQAIADAPKQTRKPVPRIVPAIPLTFIRPPPSARPTTPHDSATATATAPVSQPDADPQPQPAPPPEQTPIDPSTPQSKTSAITAGESERVRTPASSSESPETSLHHEDTSTAQAEAIAEDASTAQLYEPPVAAVNGQAGVPSPASAHPEPHPQAPPFGGNEDAFYPPLARNGHKPHPSLDNIVFGAAQESPAPSTPHELAPENGGENRMLPHSLPQDPAAFAPPQFAPPLYSGHSHHPSNHQLHWTNRSFPPGSSDGSHAPAVDMHRPQFSGQPAYQGEPHGEYHPRHTLPPNVATNGSARSQSQSPFKSQFSAKGSSEHDGEPYGVPYSNGTVPQSGNSALQPAQSAKYREPLELAAYLTGQMGNPEFSDFHLRFRAAAGSFVHTVPVHGIIVARSRTILSAIQNPVPPAPLAAKPSPTLVHIPVDDTFITPQSLNEGIRVLYGAPLLTVDSFRYRLGPFDNDGEQGPTHNDARSRMSQAISYAAAGKFLQLYNMHERGIELIKGLMRWDTVDLAISYALATGPYAHDKPSGRVFTGNTSSPAEYMAAQLLDHDVVDFIAFNFPSPFNFYPIAPEMRLAPRLPAVIEKPTHNPRLSRIRFGDVPPEDELKPDYVTRALSSILLSLPLPVLDRLFNHREVMGQLMWNGTLQKLMGDVIGERERRREKALNSRPLGMDNGFVPMGLAENMFWQENVTPSSQHPSGYTLSEARVGDHV